MLLELLAIKMIKSVECCSCLSRDSHFHLYFKVFLKTQGNQNINYIKTHIQIQLKSQKQVHFHSIHFVTKTRYLLQPIFTSFKNRIHLLLQKNSCMHLSLEKNLVESVREARTSVSPYLSRTEYCVWS